jgi:hypothetical protein
MGKKLILAVAKMLLLKKKGKKKTNFVLGYSKTSTTR